MSDSRSPSKASVSRRRPLPPQRRSWRPVALVLSGLLALVLIILGIVLGSARVSLSAIQQVDPRLTAVPAGELQPSPTLRPGQPTPVDAPLPPAINRPFSVLLIGVDRRVDLLEGVRGDTLIYVYVNPAEQWAGMLSIPRDSVVEIARLGQQQKINYAYSWGYQNAEELFGSGTPPEAGGGAIAAETVENFLHIKVDYIAQVDFSGFERIVDTVGGVLIDIPRPLLDPEYPTADYGYERLFIPAGLQVLDGRTALQYARSRHSSSDFDRSARQQLVLRALLTQVQRRGLLEQAQLLPQLARELERTVSTTLPVSDLNVLRGLASIARKLDSSRIISLSINPSDVPLLSENGSDLYWERQGVALLVSRLLSGPQATSETAVLQVLNATGEPGLARRVTGYLSSRGFTANEPADAAQRAERSLLIDYSGRPQTMARLRALLELNDAQIIAPDDPLAPPQPFETDIVLIVGADYPLSWTQP